MPHVQWLSLLFTILSISTTPTLSAVCPSGQYTSAAGACAQCPLPTQYSPGGTVTVCSACAPGSMISGTACATCAAGKFSSASASTACHACPSGTASAANAPSCVRCDATGAAKLANGLTACPPCNSTCTACIPGRYNDGATKRCTGCAAGKFSTVTQAVSSDACSPCAAGQTTLPTTTGASACIPCATANLPSPRSASHATVADTLVCAWQCSPGYTRFNFSEATYSSATYTALGYTAAQAAAVFHNRNDFCCEPSSVLVGMYMCGTALPTCQAGITACSRTSDGESAACAAVGNAHFVAIDKYKFNRCPDWVCDDYFFLNKTSGVCTAQPTCQAGHTYQRTATTGEYTVQSSGSFTCVPCSICIDGSEIATPCSQKNDTACRICAPTEFSYRAGACTPTVPFGFNPTRIRVTSIPVFQGRPSAYFDSVTPVAWGDIDFAQGFFLNSYTPCLPATSAAHMFIGGDETCNRLDISPPSLCLLPICKVQCKPWNGVEGWYRLKTGDCSKCTYDATCTSLQYTDMTTCGPTTAPKCMPCPTIPLPNSLGWLNPGRTPFPGPYPCDMVCRDGFAKGGNYSCIPCPAMPANSKITAGCNWTCSLGFVQDRTACIQCVGVPAGCAVGYYIGYASAASQCARCLPCTNLVANSAYTSTGQPNGPNTCGIQCLSGSYVSPGYGFDAYDNPVACDRCSAPACAAGETYFQPCSYLSDAVCVPCSQCTTGTRTLTQCAPEANTTCEPCDDALLLPGNAAWTEPGCTAWACAPGFVRQPNTTVCLKCKVPGDCIYSDSFEDDGSGCGRCVGCDLYLLLVGQCFNGDGQCGVSYLCDMPGVVIGTDLTIPPSQPDIMPAASEGEGSIQPFAMDQASAAPDQPIVVAYASMATLTITEPAPFDADLIASLNDQISIDCACDATVVAITQNNVTTFCAPPSSSAATGPSDGCSHPPPPASRRLMAAESFVTIDIALISRSMIERIPNQPSCNGRSVVAWQAYACQPITDAAFLRDRRRLVVQFKRTGVVWERPAPTTAWTQPLSILVIVLCCAAALTTLGLLMRGTQQQKHYEAIAHQKADEEGADAGAFNAEDVKRSIRGRTSRVYTAMPTRSMRLPGEGRLPGQDDKW